MLAGSLDNTNAVSSNAPDDVAMALGFGLGPINPFNTVTFSMLISENGGILGSFSLVHKDSLSADTVITFSGQAAVTAPVPEPATLLLLGGGLMVMLGRRRWRKA